jgi:hypothetical protein
MESRDQGNGDSDGARSSAAVAQFDHGLNKGLLSEPCFALPALREQRKPAK